jgi:hypothetical protein
MSTEGDKRKDMADRFILDFWKGIADKYLAEWNKSKQVVLNLK